MVVLEHNGATHAGDRWALVIGIDGYDAQNVGRLRFAAADARRLRDALVQDAGFAAERVVLLTDAGREAAGRTDRSVTPTYTTLRGQIRKFAQEHGASDVLILYFAGHGFRSDATGKDYLAPIDVQPADLDGTGIPVDWVLKNLKDSGARQAALIVDACRNAPASGGRALGGSAMGVARSMGVWYMASCGEGQISQEDQALGGGVYSYYLAEGLRGPADGAGGHPRDGFVTVPEAQAYATEKVEAWSRTTGGRLQTPCRSQFDVSGGEMVLSAPGRVAEPIPVAPIATTATLRVEGTAGARIFIDGQQRGTAPCEITIDLGRLQEKTVEIVAEKAGYRSVAGRVTLQRGRTGLWRPELERVTPPVQPTPTPQPTLTSPGKPWERPGTHAGQEIVGPAGIPLVWVPGGSFMMGSEEGSSDRKPVHRVELSGFWIGKTEVTVSQWRSVMGSVSDGQEGDDHPVMYVSWNDCKEFCRKAGLELPTEAQWEYAARGPESRTYPWGDEWDPKRLAWWENRARDGRTFPVGSFPSGASWCGALDMSGNVWEWCADWYDSDYYRSSPGTDPPGPSSGDYRVLRGGSWSYLAGDCRAAYRNLSTPDGTYYNFGFRVARSCR